jgi:hypothetical protein
MTTKRPRERPIVSIRALDYRWIELANAMVPGSIQPEAKAAWRLQFRREGDVEWSSIEIVTINAPPPDDPKEWEGRMLPKEEKS